VTTLGLLLSLKRPVDLVLSPDGEQLAFAVCPVATDTRCRPTGALWTGRVGDTLSEVDTAPAEIRRPRFSADGSELAFLSDAGHPGRMAVHARGGGEIGALVGSIEDFRWSSDGGTILALAADPGTDGAALESPSRGRSDADSRVLGLSRPRRRLFVLEVDSGAAHDVTPRGIDVFEFDWVGGRVLAVCADHSSESAWYDAWLGIIDFETGHVEIAYKPTWQIQCPRISQGGRMAWIEGIASDRGAVTGVIRALDAGGVGVDVDATWIAFTSDERLLYAGRRGPCSTYGSVTLDGRVTEKVSLAGVFGSRTQVSVAIDAIGARVAAVLETTDAAPEIFLLDEEAPKRLTALNENISRSLAGQAEWQFVEWRGRDDAEIAGLLALPPRRAGALPLVVYVHGGPAAVWPWMSFSHRAYLHPLLFVDEGYAVLLPNPRGSVGRGSEFARANLGDLGGEDLNDILAGIDALVAAGIADNARVAIAGSSYGGFMAGWAATQTDRFAAAVPCAMVSDWLSFHLTTNIRRFDEIFMQTDPFDRGGAYALRSPVLHARRCRTPTLLHHGEDDRCAPLGQSVEFFNALVEAGCEAELVIYPREAHSLTERAHQIEAWERTREWLARHVRDSRVTADVSVRDERVAFSD
jgi:dipeptidyl aminopeptidase/acylaminoacyl peptidase